MQHQLLPDVSSQRYWASKLQGMNLINLPGVNAHATSSQIVVHSQTLDARTLELMRANAQKGLAPIDQTLISTFILLLRQCLNDEDITIGVQTDDTNCIPLRSTEQAAKNFAAFRCSIDTNLHEGKCHSLNPISIYNLLPTSLRRSLRSQDLPFEVLMSITGSDNQDNPTIKPGLFHIKISNLNDNAVCSIHFEEGLLSDEYAQSLLSRFRNGLRATAKNPETPLSAIPFLTDADMDFVSEYNDTYAENKYPNVDIGELLHLTAQRFSDRPATIFYPGNKSPEITITYQQLDERATQIARYLRETLRLAEGSVVAISITRRADIYAYVLGIMRAGLIFLPLETTNSNVFKRRLECTNASVYLVDNQTVEMFASKENRVNVDHVDTQTAIKNQSTEYRRFFDYDPKKVAYIMFSSGTSGNGIKAPVIAHGAINNLMTGLANENFVSIDGNESDQHLSIMHSAPVSFDASIYDVLLNLVKAGVMIFTCEDDRLSSTIYAEKVRKHNIQYAATLPKLARNLPIDLARIFKRITIMGQSDESQTTEEWHDANPELYIDIGFGPTECGICTHLYRHRRNQLAKLIGRPIANMKVVVLNPKTLAMCGPNMVGEMFFTGPGLGKEYLDNPKLTAEKFIHLKLDLENQCYIPSDANDPQVVLFYRSGDTSYYTRDDEGKPNLVFCGRSDRNVKIYGVNVNLDAEEASILANPKVKDVAVVAVKHPNHELVWIYAFVCMHDAADEEDIKFELREWMKSDKNPIAIPEIAHPQFVPRFNPIEMTPNGKTDYKKYELIANTLSLEERMKMTVDSSHDEIVNYLIKLWSDTLVQKITENDVDVPYVNLGGNSMHLPALEAKINITLSLAKEFEIRIGSRDDQSALSMNMTIESLATTLTKNVSLSKNTQKGQQLQQSLRESATHLRGLFSSPSIPTADSQSQQSAASATSVYKA